MTQPQPDQIVGQLHSALQSERVPSRQKALGAQILDHLSEAVRVVVLGRQGSGKTCLINMMLGEELVSHPNGVEILEVVYGPSLQITVQMSDGATQRVSAGDIASRDFLNAARITYEVPHDMLKAQSFCEFSLADRSQLQTALTEGQVFLWCSEAFDPSEQALWASVPDVVKDHSFLALTKADRQIMKGALSNRLVDLEAVVSNEFLGLHPVATLHALKARTSDTPQPDLWDASGGRELVDAVRSQVQKGRAADLDQAAMLLAQLGDVAAPKAVPQPVPNATDHPAIEAQADVLEQLQAHLQAAAQEMLHDMDAGKIPNAEAVVTRCSEAVQTLTRMLTDEGCGDAKSADLLENTRDGEDTLMLLQVEQSPTAAADAVILLLQLKKEIGARSQP